jgi:hypothetical protein
MKKDYTEAEIQWMKDQCKIPVGPNEKYNSDFLYNLKGKHREAMYAAVQIANAQIDKKVEAMLKASLPTKQWKELTKISKIHKKQMNELALRTTKKIEKFMAKHGLTQLEGIYTPPYGDTQPASIHWYGLETAERANPFLQKTMREIKNEARKSLSDLRQSLLAIQETGHAKPKPVNFPEPIRAELQKFENRGLLPANV